MQRTISRKKLIEVLLWVAVVIATIGLGLGIGQWSASCRHNDLLDKQLHFTVQTDSGKNVSPADSTFAGKPMVINFWAIWCPPCKAELPDFQEVYDAYKDKVNFLFINEVQWRDDSISSVRSFMQANGYDFPVYYDVTGEAGTSCNVSSIPLTLFVGKDGKVAYTYNAAMSKAQIVSQIEKLL
ncbi:MAG: TlpA family protein disulfide reductase [Clostridia bacterium]|nr:TlpA family protein disulfide reductase [Clostridia bacterium]